MSGISQEIKTVKGVGALKARDFSRLGLATLYDVLYDFPFRYDDLSNILHIAEVRSGQKITVQGRIAAIENRKSHASRRMMITEAVVEDGTGTIKATWFHQGFLTKVLRPGVIVSLAGKVDDKYGLALVNPAYEVIGNARSTTHTGRIVPIYRLAGALTQKVRRIVAERAVSLVGDIAEWMPSDIVKDAQLIPLATALREMHFPETTTAKEKAIHRLKFDEFFLHQLLHAKSRRELQRQRAPKITFNEKIVKDAVASLPFVLTDAQKKSAWAIMKDMQRTEPMNRLLEGDVGSGKTAVAALVAVNAASQGWQTAMLAPTEILAEQHAMTLERLFGKTLRIALYTRTKRRVNGREVTKEQLLEGLRNGKVDLAIGTHALLTEQVLFDRLGLIVVDEQHRFGVRQRQALKDKQGDADGIPHLLSMTATPIPRSLALVLYGDLDRSLLDEYPAGRKPIATSIVDVGREGEAYGVMKKEMDAGRQVFVVCPLIEESDALGVQSVNEVYAHFAEGPFKEYKIAMLHGKLKTKEKDDVMRAFARGEFDMLIATTVVEVGIDVQNATVMYVEGAERFGLAQLHQLRGRVGRGEHASVCFLHPSAMLSLTARERLLALVESQNGFELAEADLRLRGPGDVFGTRQSGFEQFKLGTYADIDVISMAKDYAKTMLDDDPDLARHPLLRDRMLAYAQEVHFE